MTDDDCRGDRNGSPEGLSLPTTASSSGFVMLWMEVLGSVLAPLGSEFEWAIPSFDWVSMACMLALSGERGLSGESLSSAGGTPGESLHVDSRSTSGGQVVRENSSGTDEAESCAVLSLGVGIETSQKEWTSDHARKIRAYNETEGRIYAPTRYQ